ncbi:MAG: hypothetical protein Q7T80_09455 [Methanoregula sp.]|nr:hypothetical protein [Methanoregula sp.]
MTVIQERENQNSVNIMHDSGVFSEKKPMHPEDFKAHLAWVTAKQVHEIILKRAFLEKPVCYRSIG